MQPSHYAREKVKDKQFLASDLSIAQVYRDFLDTKGLTQKDRDLPISYNSFRKIFRGYKLGFKRPLVDTCGKCDSFSIIKRFSNDEDEVQQAERMRQEHLAKADLHYKTLQFDLNELPKLRNRDNADWRMPPQWKKI